jgi:hypothetical protein
MALACAAQWFGGWSWRGWNTRKDLLCLAAPPESERRVMRKVEIKKIPWRIRSFVFRLGKTSDDGCLYLTRNNIKSAFKDTQATDHKHRTILVK